MNCKYCQNPIGLIRSLKDREYCSDAHKAAGNLRSARALRALGVMEYHGASPWDEPGDAPSKTAQPVKPTKLPQLSSARPTVVILSLIGILGMSLIGIATSSKSESGANKFDQPPGWFATHAGSLLARFSPAAPATEFRYEFTTPSLASWVPAGSGAGWSFDNGLVRPGALRLWKDSRELSDYRFQFEGRIESTSINWVVRAADPRNYHATKLTVTGRGDDQTTELVRYTVLNGQESRRVRLPLPIHLEDQTFYEYEVRTSGDRFMTLVGGKVVDVFRDPRLSAGGVGFFSENRERSSIRWARIASTEEFTGKLRSFLTFGLVLPIVE